ncbi:GNAT family N-acetyltransferase [Silvimonas sp.]|uniref:GNAT family N-acetyltransferase n=1 Tax=Silvimonas sp. TaxID=2650811 RepID=UPI00283B7FF3|nr:GNAT family N-acetyltransferase [Silvimonas sp.]MDR3428595.1 GNAT family N-acetyltransferase [Silvimonas sp.]
MPKLDPFTLNIPTEIITSRLILRPPMAGDGTAVYAAVCESLTALRQFPASLPWAVAEPSVASSEEWCQQRHADFLARKDLAMLAWHRETGELVLATGLHRLDWAVPKFELGFWCRSSKQGQGLVSEAARALLGLAWETLGARRVEALCDAANLPSRRVCERIGMTLEGVMRNERITPTGELCDTCVYAAIKP